MARNLVVFADGTGNSAASPSKTNVWRAYQALDLAAEDQLAVFDDGVGTSSFKPFKYLGLALGLGVKRRVLDLYRFLCRNYHQDDRIYGFGFSRGAFIIRLLNGMIHSQGLVVFHSEEQLARDAANAFRAYRKASYPTRLPWVKFGRIFRDQILSSWYRVCGFPAYATVAKRAGVEVHFLGLWDTVSAYGLPIEELTRAWDKWVWPLSFPNHKLPKNVRFARHALSLDDERRTFFPIPWDEPAPAGDHLQPAYSSLSSSRLLQVWFAGVHANVGGGYPDDRLAHVPLCWIIAEATAKGLRFDPDTVAHYAALASPTGRLYDSRRGFGMIYRYQPRNVGVLMGGATPLVDGSVVMRIDRGDDAYAPISLPEKIDILAPGSVAIAFAPPAAVPQPPQQAALLAAIARLTGINAASRARHLALAEDFVWWRRVAYYTTLLVALGAIVFLLVSPSPTDYLTKGIAAVLARPNHSFGWIAKAVIPLLAGVVPSVFAPLLARIADNPTVLGIAAVILMSLIWESSWLQTRIHDFARAAWKPAVRPGMARRAATRARKSSIVAAVVYGILFLLALSNFFWSRTETSICQAPTLLLLLLAVLTVVYLVRSVDRATALGGGLARWKIFSRPLKEDSEEEPGALLRIARYMRTAAMPRQVAYRTAWTILPFVFIACCLALAVVLVNRLSFEVPAAVGVVCKSADTIPLGPVDGFVRVPTAFDISDLCWPSGLKLVAGARYRIWIEMPSDMDWFDRTFHTDVGGFPGGDLRHITAYPLKRRWGQNWFQPIARIDADGNDEYVLSPLSPLPELPPGSTLSDKASDRTDSFWSEIVDTFIPIDDRRAKEATQAQPRGPGRRVLVSELTAGSTGELFLYVNDAIFGWSTLFYRNNKGTASVAVELLKAPLPPDEARR